MGGGLLSNIGTHIIDIITYVTGLKAKRVHGLVKNYCQLKDNGMSSISSLKKTQYFIYLCHQFQDLEE
jgi:predicted dehydrogenase